MHETSITACFTGHRPKDLPWGYDESKNACKNFKTRLKKAIIEAVAAGFSHFITGMAEGVDTYAAEILVCLRDQSFFDVTIEAAVPCKTQNRFWSYDSRERYSHLLSKMDKVTVISEHYTPWCMHERNNFMLENSSLVIAGFLGKKMGGTFSTLEKAKALGKQIIVISPTEI